MIDLIKAVLLGIVQGLTEFLPISSSGHLTLGQHFLGLDTDAKSFGIFLHLGTLFAVLIYFRKDIWQILSAFFTVKYDEVTAGKRKIGWLILAATFITGIAYYIFKDPIDSLFETKNTITLYIVSIFIAVSGLMNYVSDKISSQRIKAEQLNLPKALLIGVGQAFALNPGISRSGSTITFGLLVGLNRKDVATFSFLLSIPAILGAVLTEVSTLKEILSQNPLQYILAGLAAFITGYLVISFLLRLLRERKMKYFAYYCWGIALICIILIAMGI